MDVELQNAVQPYNAGTLSNSRDAAWLVSALQGDSVSMKANSYY